MLPGWALLPSLMQENRGTWQFVDLPKAVHLVLVGAALRTASTSLPLFMQNLATPSPVVAEVQFGRLTVPIQAIPPKCTLT